MIALPCAFTCWEVRVKLCLCQFWGSCSTWLTCTETNLRAERARPAGLEACIAAGSEKQLRMGVNSPRASSQEGQAQSRGDSCDQILAGEREPTALGLSALCAGWVANPIPLISHPSTRSGHSQPLAWLQAQPWPGAVSRAVAAGSTRGWAGTDGWGSLRSRAGNRPRLLHWSSDGW